MIEDGDREGSNSRNCACTHVGHVKADALFSSSTGPITVQNVLLCSQCDADDSYIYIVIAWRAEPGASGSRLSSRAVYAPSIVCLSYRVEYRKLGRRISAGCHIILYINI